LSELEIKPTRAARMRVFAVAGVSVLITSYLIFLLAGGEGDIFARRTTLTSYMPDASGLIPGASGSEVRLSGIRIGYVSAVDISPSLDPQRAVRVQLRVRTPYLKSIPSDSQTDIASDTLVGYQFLDIAEGKSPIPIGENGVLDSQPAKEALLRADLVTTLRDNLAGMDQLLADISSGQTRLGQFVLGEELYDKLLSEVRGFDQAVHTFVTPQSNLGQAFYSLEAYNAIHDLVLKVDGELASIQNGQGAAGHFFASDEQYNTLVRQLADLRSQIAAVNAGKMIQNDEAYTRLQRTLRDADALLTSLNAGEGQAGQLLTNPQLYESLNGSLKGMEDMLRDFRSDPQKYLRVKIFH
jgi:phospholipid/cholesterol/gamma-HCH transport system substrate-binding protein